MSTLTSYLSSRKQKRVYQLLVEHSGTCKAISHTFVTICKAWSEGKTEEALINKLKIHTEEKNADHIEAELLLEVAKSQLSDNKLKEDLAQFVRHLDAAAGASKRSATNMVLLMDYPLPEEFAKLIDEASHIIASIFNKIDEAVKNLEDTNVVIEIGHLVDKMEGEVDVIYAKLKEGYFEIEKTFNSSAALIILDHAIRDLEACADKAEDAIELLAELVQKRI